MSGYEGLIEDAANRLQLGNRSRWVIDVMAAWVAAHPLGMDGLQQQFEQAGLGERFLSWQAPALAPVPIVASELERALGAHALATLARRAGMSTGAFRVLACELFPRLIALMSSPAGRARFACPGTRHPGRRLLPDMTSSVPLRAMYGMALRSALWLLVVVAVLGIAAWLQLKAHTPLWVYQDIVRDGEPYLSLRQQGQQVLVQGRLPTEGERRRVWSALVALHGKGNVRGDIMLDPRTQDPLWLPALIRRLPQLQGDGLALEFTGERLVIDTTAMTEPQRLSISRSLREDFGRLSMTGLWGPGLSALSALPLDADDVQLVDALNLTTLNFRPGSSELTGDSLQTVAAIATALRAAPGTTRLQVAAHTDNTGNAEANLRLSQQRAAEVTQTLLAQGVPPAMLVPVGHGQEQPVADNRSESGRAQNRRIAYQLLENAP